MTKLACSYWLITPTKALLIPNRQRSNYKGWDAARTIEHMSIAHVTHFAQPRQKLGLDSWRKSPFLILSYIALGLLSFPLRSLSSKLFTSPESDLPI